MKLMSKFRCTVCNWVYDEDKEDIDFDELQESFTCPVCGAPKSAFKHEGVMKESGDIETNVADKIVEQLESFGVKYVYGIPGDSNLPLVDSIRKSEKIDFILTRHEETAAFMATACQQYRLCETGDCPVGVTTQDQELRDRLRVDISAKKLENYLRATAEELEKFARLTGNDDVHDMSIDDLCTTNSEISDHTEIEHV